MAWPPLKQAKQCQGNTHNRENTLRVFSRTIASLAEPRGPRGPGIIKALPMPPHALLLQGAGDPPDFPVWSLQHPVLTTLGMSVILLGVMVPLAVRRYSRMAR
jgi:hypothetical protein